MAHARQSRPDSGLGVIENFHVVPFSLLVVPFSKVVPISLGSGGPVTAYGGNSKNTAKGTTEFLRIIPHEKMKISPMLGKIKTSRTSRT